METLWVKGSSYVFVIQITSILVSLFLFYLPPPAQPVFLSWVCSSYSPILHSVLSTHSLSLVLVIQILSRALLPAQRPPKRIKSGEIPSSWHFLTKLFPVKPWEFPYLRFCGVFPQHLTLSLYHWVVSPKQDLNSWQHKICSFWDTLSTLGDQNTKPHGQSHKGVFEIILPRQVIPSN